MIQFERLGYFLPQGYLFSNVNLQINKGDKVGLVGKNGAGKSTLSRLLYRFYEVGSGAILIDGQDIRDIAQISLRKNIGIVPQDTVLFNDSIAYNIAYGRPDASQDEIEAAAKALIAHKGAALVVSGSNNPAVQTIVNAINSLLGSYGTTIDLGTPVNYRQGNDAEMTAFINEVKGGQVSTAIFLSNPVYDHARGAELGEALSKVATTISFADRADETASKCKYIAPAPHYLESWNDAEPKKGFFSLTQPTISLIFDTRQPQSSLLTWAGLNSDYHAYLKSNWSKNILSGKSWVQALHDGVYEPAAGATASGASFAGNVDAAAASIAKVKGAGIELNRKVLADLAMNHPEAFAAIVNQVK